MEARLVIQCCIGGLFMGLANLVPGISGGTMLLAAGIYPLFIGAIAEVTSFKFSKKSILVLICVGASAAFAIMALAGVVRDLVLNQRWIMYSLFIGLTLGGVPVLKKLLRKLNTKDLFFVFLGLVVMTLVGLSQVLGFGTGGDEGTGWVLLLIAGTAGASAMILPGVSGGYLLLVLGCYIPILNGIDQFKDGLKLRDFDQIFSVGQSVILPVGLGVLFGIVVVSHLLKWCLNRFERPTYSFLLGLLMGAVVGLYPFQELIPMDEIETIKSQPVELVEGVLTYQESGKEVKAKDFPTKYVIPDFISILLSSLFIGLGLFITTLVSWYGGKTEESLARN